jgi:hypothetical protein
MKAGIGTSLSLANVRCVAGPIDKLNASTAPAFQRLLCGNSIAHGG